MNFHYRGFPGEIFCELAGGIAVFAYHAGHYARWDKGDIQLVDMAKETFLSNKRKPVEYYPDLTLNSPTLTKVQKSQLKENAELLIEI
jgi:hypothetical protein